MTDMKNNKKELGKGIRALLANIEAKEADNPVELVKDLSSNVAMLSISNIIANPHQPRKDFDQQSLKELSESLKTYGLIQPVTVRRLEKDLYQLISGERRFRAAKLAELDEIPAYVRIADDQEMLEMALVENIQRKDLNALEVAFTYQRLLDECNITHEGLASRISKDRSTVTNFLRLLKLPPEIQSSLKSEEISMGHARALLGVDDVAQMIYLYRQVKDQNLSVRDTEALVKKQNVPQESKANTATTKDHAIRKIQDDLSDVFDTKVDVKQTPTGKGNIIIHFANTLELNRILDLLEKN